MATTKKQQAEAITLVLEMILDGELDGEEDRLYDAIKQRSKYLAQQLKAQLRKNDKVRFSQTARPAYLRGVEATVSGFTNTKVLINIDAGQRKAGRYAGAKDVACPPTILEKI